MPYEVLFRSADMRRAVYRAAVNNYRLIRGLDADISNIKLDSSNHLRLVLRDDSFLENLERICGRSEKNARLQQYKIRPISE